MQKFLSGVADCKHLEQMYKFDRKKKLKCTFEVHKLVYANDGESVMALSSNCTHKLWRWNKTCFNPSGKATSCESPIQLLPSDGLMNNDVGVVDIEEHSFALTKDNRYLISTSGGPVSLFNVTDAELSRRRER
ncbi:Topless-related protein 1 [Carex littledalei]|uniref:Topless-related protein 1 n=1 Tax=Carex littledalei TaxID=544730 RepID=A0A833QVT3_9POAL|nr:Topless-related protein 1 [Carex littledalei]